MSVATNPSIAKAAEAIRALIYDFWSRNRNNFHQPGTQRTFGQALEEWMTSVIRAQVAEIAAAAPATSLEASEEVRNRQAGELAALRREITQLRGSEPFEPLRRQIEEQRAKIEHLEKEVAGRDSLAEMFPGLSIDQIVARVKFADEMKKVLDEALSR